MLTDAMKQRADYVMLHLNPNRKILFLTGDTEDERKVLLRNCVIPYMEESQHGFFLRQVFNIMPLMEPMRRLAENTYDFLTSDFSITTPLGKKVIIDFTEAFFGIEKRNDFIAESLVPHFLPRVFALIAQKIPLTYMPIFALDKDFFLDDHIYFRFEFYEFLAHFITTEADMKMIISLHAEFALEFFAYLMNVDLKTKGKIGCFIMK